jgi:hypothetical protein
MYLISMLLFYFNFILSTLIGLSLITKKGEIENAFT